MESGNKFDQTTIEIIDNVMKYENEAIQISSISQIRVAKEPAKPYSIATVLLLIVSVCGMFALAPALILWLIISIVCGIKIFLVYDYNTKLSTYLIVEMNSGRSSLFSAKEQSFLNSAKDSLIECFNRKDAHMTINFESCNVNGNYFGTDGKVINKSE